MATYSANVTQKIATGGGAFNFTTNGTHTIVTTTAKQRAKVVITNLFVDNNGVVATQSASLRLNTTPIVEASTDNVSSSKSQIVRSSVPVNGDAVGRPFEIDVPPSSTLDVVIAGAGAGLRRCSGTVVLFENTP